MWMPNLDGEGLVKAIRQTPAIATLPVLVVTADVEIRSKSSEMGFNGILLKPVTIDTLGKAISCGL
jgi:CheY-like chemotaxis protein